MGIISQSESRQIFKNDLKRRALEKYAAELKYSNSEARQKIMAQVEQEVEAELRKHDAGRSGGFWSSLGGLFH